MKELFKAFAFPVALVLFSPQLYAKPAKPGLIEMHQPDGAAVSLRLVGDENFHYWLSEDGYPVVETSGGFFFGKMEADGRLAATARKAAPPAERSPETREYLRAMDLKAIASGLDMQAALAPRRACQATPGKPRKAAAARAAGEGYKKGYGLVPGTSFPSAGEQKAVVILAEYADVRFNLDNPHDYFSRMLNEPGFADYGGTGSAKEYFEECSGGLFRPQFDVYGPVTLSRNMAYYGGNYSGNDANPGMMVVEACQQLDATVDFSQYDRDGDGYIDNVFLFYAGYGEATGGGADTVWPHSWGITAAYPTKEYIFDGVQLDRYACSNEWEGYRPDGVGTFIHEFSHVMGLPDLYTTAYTAAFTPGAWSALDYGPYNNEGMTPPLYGAFERYALGWIDLSEIREPLNATLPPVGTNTAGIIRTEKEYEFFLLENRQKTSWDTYIPGHGMLVWHIDYDLTAWRDNCVNNSLTHQHVDIEEADNLPTTSTRDGDAFPGYDGITSFTDNTSPSMRTWNGKGLGLPITEIAESEDGMITFKVAGGGEPLVPTVALAADNVTEESFTARWQEVAKGMEYVISVYTRGADGIARCLPGWMMRRTGAVTSCEVTGLSPETEYFYTVSTARGLETAPASNEISVFTGEPTIAILTVEALEASGITPSSFVANWQPLEGATDYEITVFTKTYDAEIFNCCDFTDGVNPLPKGWNSSSTSSFANASYSGEAIPALRLSNNEHITASFADGVRSVSFWHRGSSTSAEDVIRVYAVLAQNRSLIAEVPVSTDKGGVVTEIKDFPEGTESVRIEFVRNGAKGSLAVDDIRVGHGYAYAPLPLADYNAKSTGGTSTSHIVEGLDSSTEYYYTVRASDGIRLSRPSAETKVVTGAPSGVGTVDAVRVSVSVSGHTLAVEAPAGADVSVCDMLGRVIAQGSGMFELPAGIYIVAADGYVVKVIVK